MLLKDKIKQLRPCIINRSIESTNEIIKIVNNIKQDNANVVIEKFKSRGNIFYFALLFIYVFIYFIKC